MTLHNRGWIEYRLAQPDHTLYWIEFESGWAWSMCGHQIAFLTVGTTVQINDTYDEVVAIREWLPWPEDAVDAVPICRG